DFRSVQVWDATTGQLLRTLPAHDWMIYCLAYSRDGLRLASGSRDGAVKVSEASTGRSIRTLNEESGRTSAVAFSPDDRYLAGARDGALTPRRLQEYDDAYVTDPISRAARLHADRIAGGHRHHRRPGRTAPAGGAVGARGGPPDAVYQQPQADRPGHPPLHGR